MPLRLVRDGTIENEDIPGVDRHYYVNQIGPKSPFDDTYEFRLAAAIAKDKARHQLIRAVRKADEDARYNRGRLEELADITNQVAFGVTRSVDGVEGAPDNAIKL